MIRQSHVVALLALMLVGLSPLLTGADAASVTRADREASYPPQVVNITHRPWSPSAGQDLEVLLTLEEGTATPGQVALLFCRVEPEYTCALPTLMEPQDDPTSWRGVIRWDPKFMKPETVHIGYNVTLRYLDADGAAAQRVYAPTGNYWFPDTFPDDSDGNYFFVPYERAAGGREAPFLSPLHLLALVLGPIHRWRR